MPIMMMQIMMRQRLSMQPMISVWIILCSNSKSKSNSAKPQDKIDPPLPPYLVPLLLAAAVLPPVPPQSFRLFLLQQQEQQYWIVVLFGRSVCDPNDGGKQYPKQIEFE